MGVMAIRAGPLTGLAEHRSIALIGRNFSGC